MSSTPDLFDDFVDSRNHATPFPDDRDHTDTFRTTEHQLIQVIHGAAQVVAGWQEPGTFDVSIWIDREFRGWARTNLEDRLRDANMIIMNVLPADTGSTGTDVLWWAYPAECMSCGDPLPDNRRQRGLCDPCVDLRAGVYHEASDRQLLGIEQRRGLHGEPMPHRRPTER